MSNVIYIAGPIGNGHTVGPRVMYANVRQAEKVMFELMKKGWSVTCPHLSYHAWIDWPEDISWKRWMQSDYALIQKADAFFYMKPEIYGESKGALQELEWANQRNIPIYDSLKIVPTVTLPKEII